MCWNNVEVMLTLVGLDKLQNIRTLVRKSSKYDGRAFFSYCTHSTTYIGCCPGHRLHTN